MAFYRSGFIAADERAKSILKYFDSFSNPELTEKEVFNLALSGNGILHDILMGTEYYQRLSVLNERVNELQKKKHVSKRLLAFLIVKLQHEYTVKAGVFGKRSLRVVEKRGSELDDMAVRNIEKEFTDGEVEEDA